MSETSMDFNNVASEDVVCLYTAEGEEVKFIKLAVIAYRCDFYAVLKPMIELSDLAEDQALVFKVVRDARGGETLSLETDDKILDAVYTEYKRLLEEKK